MDAITILQNRIEQLEAKLGLAAGGASSPLVDPMTQHHQQGDSVTTNLLNTAQAMNNATAGLEKLPQAMNMASELNNYTDPNFVENMQQNEMHMQEVAAAEPAIRHHCHCMHRCQQGAPVLESEAIQQVPQMQAAVNNLHAAAAEVKMEADAVSQGVQELAETCGQAASNASEQLANVAQKVENAEEKMFPKRRNGLD
ncbi:uncharacterized protein LOC126382160 [Pectinophora gossypiella]|uniref:Uncharacterized protein n=1 Tax=Pectinophora gossypiella TaxID=13191 RepID=A0A1E1WQ63_PECGO|nr:uncharacterized protein LOC126382160 [Pectinophora gossypiella]XP_049887896.1 uncharacterized protein LOC126382160 [Pectinophora gossypiella]